MSWWCQCAESDCRRPGRGVAASTALSGAPAPRRAGEGFTGRADQLFVLHTHGRLACRAGGGRRPRPGGEMDAGVTAAGGRPGPSRGHARDGGAGRGAPLPATPPRRGRPACPAEGVAAGRLPFRPYRTEGARSGSRSSPSVALLPDGAGALPVAGRDAAAGAPRDRGDEPARDLVNEPAGQLTPARLAEEARRRPETARAASCAVERPPRARQKMRMGMFSAVGQGSAEHPAAHRAQLRPKEGRDRRGPWCWWARPSPSTAGACR